jgi:hypothetical protein
MICGPSSSNHPFSAEQQGNQFRIRCWRTNPMRMCASARILNEDAGKDVCEIGQISAVRFPNFGGHPSAQSAKPHCKKIASNGAGFANRFKLVAYLKVDPTRWIRKPIQGPIVCNGKTSQELKLRRRHQPKVQMIGRMIASVVPAARRLGELGCQRVAPDSWRLPEPCWRR